MHRPRLTVLGEQTVKQLRTSGCELTDADILRLYSLADQATNGAQDDRLLFYPYKRFGNLEIHPLSLAAKIWLNTQVQEWFALDPDMLGACRVYAHHFSRHPNAFDFHSPKHCRKQIHKWAKGQKADAAMVLDAINDLDATAPDDPKEGCKTCTHMKQLGECSNPEALAMMEGTKVHPEFRCRFYRAKTDLKTDSIAPTIALLNTYFPGHDDDYWLAKPDRFVAQMIARALDIECSRMGQQGRTLDRHDPCILADKALKALKAEILAREQPETTNGE